LGAPIALPLFCAPRSPARASAAERPRGTLVLDPSGLHPRCVLQMALSAVNTLMLLEDATDFDCLDGHIDAKLDLSASGESIHAMASSADIEFQDATIRGVNLPTMVQLLTKKSRQRWHDDKNTRLESLGATSQVKDGVAATDDLHAIGPLMNLPVEGRSMGSDRPQKCHRPQAGVDRPRPRTPTYSRRLSKMAPHDRVSVSCLQRAEARSRRARDGASSGHRAQPLWCEDDAGARC